MKIHCTNSDSNYWIKGNNAIPTTLGVQKRTNVKIQNLLFKQKQKSDLYRGWSKRGKCIFLSTVLCKMPWVNPLKG